VKNKLHLELARNVGTASTCSMLRTERRAASRATGMQFAMEKICSLHDQGTSGAALSMTRYWNASTCRLVLEEIWTLPPENVQRATRA